jgi:hypothetical protein
MAWYDVAEKCIGFSEKTAATIVWNCEACEPCASGFEDEDDSSLDELEATKNREIEGRDAIVTASIAAAAAINREINILERCSDSSKPEEEVAANDGNQESTARELSAAKSLIQFRITQASQALQGSDNVRSSWALTDQSPGKKSKAGLASLQNSSHLSSSGSPETNQNEEQKGRQRSDGCILPKRPPVCRADGTYVKPVGNPPNKNLEWDENEGLWVPKSRLKSPRKRPSPGATSKERKGLAPPPSKNKKKLAEPMPSSSSKKSRILSRKKSQESSNESAESCKEASTETKPPQIFQKGDLVEVESHSWACINNLGGVGYVTDIQIDDEGDRNYQIKYVIGRRFEWCLGKFMSPKCFD